MLEIPQKYLLVIIGPTAVGKTDLCVKLAQEFNTSIISADSRQFYKEMSIGTAKPTIVEMKGVPHFFVNNRSIVDEYNVGQFEKEVLVRVEEVFKTNGLCILTGGSGLYVDAICNGIDEMPEIPMELRLQLNDEYKKDGLEKLVSELKSSDPEYFEIVDTNNVQRVIRALEICRHTKLTYTSFRLKKKKNRPFKIIKIGLERDRDELYNRINSRIDNMISAGLFDEAKSLIPYRNHNALQTVGYKEIFDYYDGKYDRIETIRLLKRNSRRYAKRQLTWFRRDTGLIWFHPENKAAITNHIIEQIKILS